MVIAFILPKNTLNACCHGGCIAQEPRKRSVELKLFGWAVLEKMQAAIPEAMQNTGGHAISPFQTGTALMYRRKEKKEVDRVKNQLDMNYQ